MIINQNQIWFRGLSDGDGCIFVNKTTTYADFSISSSYNQDWNYIFKIFHQLNINGRISKQVNKIGRNSQIHIGNIIDIIKFLNYIYKNYESDNLFLKRKLDKYFLCKIILNNLKRKYKTTGISKSGDSFYVNFYFNKIRYYLGHFNNINLAIKAKKDKARELMPKDEFNLIYN